MRRPITIVLLPSSGKGFGHQFWAAMTGLDAAASFWRADAFSLLRNRSMLVLDASFWEVASHPGRQSKRALGPADSYAAWASGIVGLPIADRSTCVGARSVTLSISALLGREGAALREGTRSGSGSGSGNAAGSGGGAVCIRVEPGSPYACDGHWCRVAGAFDRSTRALRQLRQLRGTGEGAPPAAVADGTMDGTSRAPPALARVRIRAVWHMRTGDAVVLLHRDAVARLRESVERGLKPLAVEHVICTYSAAQLHAAYPWLRDELRLRRSSPAPLPAGLGIRPNDAAAAGDEEATGGDARSALLLMRDADVLVSTGSSFALAAASLAPTGNQLHYSFPPKELGTMRWRSASAKGAVLSVDAGADAIQAAPWWRAYFVSTNFVPLDFKGRVFDSYRTKAEKMMRALAQARGVASADATGTGAAIHSSTTKAASERRGRPPAWPVDATLASLCFEAWMASAPASTLRTAPLAEADRQRIVPSSLGGKE